MAWPCQDSCRSRDPSICIRWTSPAGLSQPLEDYWKAHSCPFLLTIIDVCDRPSVSRSRQTSQQISRGFTSGWRRIGGSASGFHSPGSALGSGLRRRRFESSRPDQFLKKSARFSQPGHSVLRPAAPWEPSARCFKFGLHPESFGFLASVARDWSIPPTFRSKVLPSTHPTSWSDTDSRS